MNLIGISGAANAGKSTVAKILVEDHGFTEIGFADELKRIAMRLWDWPPEALWGPSKNRNIVDKRYGVDGLSPRKALQYIGTEIGRALDPNVWVRIALEYAEALLDDETAEYHPEEGLIFPPKVTRALGVCFSDARFPNEVEAIRAAGGKVWRILRPTSGLVGAAGQHPSEHSLDDWGNDRFDMIINNEGGSLEDLRGLVKAAMETSR